MIIKGKNGIDIGVCIMVDGKMYKTVPKKGSACDKCALLDNVCGSANGMRDMCEYMCDVMELPDRDSFYFQEVGPQQDEPEQKGEEDEQEEQP